MRLLNATTKRLESFYGKDTPRYAILSHMWGKEEEEVSFKHIAGSDDDRREGQGRKGYSKLLAACEQAIRDGWEYIWIDTCCIEKESSAELSEAINSMYAWYRGSEVCYAYLEDVQGNKETRDDGNATFKTAPFEESRWFTRGWTLQELVAPRRVVFYSREWIDIGSKVSLQYVISAVTNIRVEMITNYDPNKASVSEKMSWAVKRETKRDEDIAYCLMGLLDVNMPPLYGEGMKAFRRLQEEIMKASDDHSIFAWKTDYTRYGERLKYLKETRGMLADSPSDFLGAGNVVRSDDESYYPPYSMSNKGLQIALPIKPVNPKELIGIDSADCQNIFKAILDCTYRDTSPTQRVVIYLKMVRKGRYVRIFPYWLDKTEVDPNEADADGWAITSLLVLHTNAPTSNHIYSVWSRLDLKILPTESGYSFRNESLVKGSYLRGDRKFFWFIREPDVFVFEREGKHFGVVAGNHGGMPWIDIITEEDYKSLSLTPGEYNFMDTIMSLYEERGSRYHVVLQHMGSLYVNVSKDHLVDVSWKSLSSSYETTVDIRQAITQVPLQICVNANSLDHLDPRNVHPNSKKEGVDWLTIRNSNVKRVLDVSPVHKLEGEKYAIILFSPDGEYLAAAGYSTVHIYNTMTSEMACVLSVKPTGGLSIHCMCFSPNGKFLATGTDSGHVLLWDFTRSFLRYDFTGHGHTIEALRFSSDSRLITSIPVHGMVQILDTLNGISEDLCDLGHEELSSAAISPNNRLVAGVRNSIIYIWDLQIRQLVEVLQGHDENVHSIAFTPDGKGLVSGSYDTTLKYWEISGLTAPGIKQKGGNSKPVNNSRSPSMSFGVDRSSQYIIEIGHKDSIRSVTVSHNGKWIISVSNRNIQFWDSKDGTVQFMLQDRFDFVRSFDISSARNILATQSGENKTQIWKYDNIEAES